jgi:hypothetical protein
MTKLYVVLQNDGFVDVFENVESVVKFFKESLFVEKFEVEEEGDVSVEEGVGMMLKGNVMLLNEELMEMGDDYSEWCVIEKELN